MQRLLLAVVMLLTGLLSPVYAANDLTLDQGDGTFQKLGGVGPAAKVTQSTLTACEDKKNSVCRVESQWQYEDVAASQTDQIMGATGAIGDLLAALYCTTSGASVGAVTVKDGAGSSFTIFLAQAGAAMLQSGQLNWVSTGGAWSVTTGTNTTCRASGRFS